MGAVIEFVVNMLLELVLWLMQLFAKSLEDMCSIKDNFIGSFSDTLLGENGLYVSNSGNALFAKGGNPMLVLQAAGLSMLVVFTAWSLVKAMFGSLAKVDSPQKILTDTFVYGIMIVTYNLWVNAFISVGFSPMYQEVQNAQGIELDFAKLVASSVAAVGTEMLLDILTGGFTTPVFLAVSVLLSLLKLIFFFTLLGKLIELILEVVERFLQIFFITIFGPLCIACGTSSALSRVATTWFHVWINSYVLFILNMFFVKLSLVAIGNLAEKCANVFTAAEAAVDAGGGGLQNTQIFAVIGMWIMVYCTIRIGTKTDQIMRSLGFDVLQADGHILNPLTQGIIGSIIGTVVGGTIEKNSGKIAEGAKKGFLGMWGLTNNINSAAAGAAGKTANKTAASTKAKAKLADSLKNKTDKANQRLTDAKLKFDMDGSGKTSTVFGQSTMDNESIEKTLNEAADIANKRGEKGVDNPDMLGTGNFDKASLEKLNDYFHSKGLNGDIVSAKIENGDLKFLVRDKDGKESYCQLHKLGSNEKVPKNAVAIGNGTWELTEKPAVKDSAGAGVTNDLTKAELVTMADVAADTADGYVKSDYEGGSIPEQYEVGAGKADPTNESSYDAETGYAVLKDGSVIARLKVADTDDDGPVAFTLIDADGNEIVGKNGERTDYALKDFIARADGQPAMFNLNGMEVMYNKKDGTIGYTKPGGELPADFASFSLDASGMPMATSKKVDINIAQKTGKAVNTTYVPRDAESKAAALVGISVYGMASGDSSNAYAPVNDNATKLIMGKDFQKPSKQGGTEVKTKAGYLVPEAGTNGYISKTSSENGEMVTKMRVQTVSGVNGPSCWINGTKTAVSDAVKSGTLEQDSRGHVWATLEKGSYTKRTVATVGQNLELYVKGQNGKTITLDSSFAQGDRWSEIEPSTDGTIEVSNVNGTFRYGPEHFISNPKTGGMQRFSYDSVRGVYEPDTNGAFVQAKQLSSNGDAVHYEISSKNLVGKTYVQDFAARSTVGDIVTNSSGVVEFDTATPSSMSRNGAVEMTSSYGQSFYNKKGDWASSAYGTGGANGVTEFRTESSLGVAYTTAVAESYVDKEVSRLSSDQARVYFSSLYHGSNQHISSVDMSRKEHGIYSVQTMNEDTGTVHDALVLSQNSFIIPRDKKGKLVLPKGVKGEEKTLDSGLKVLEIDQNSSDDDAVARFINDSKRDFQGLINKLQDMI